MQQWRLLVVTASALAVLGCPAEGGESGDGGDGGAAGTSGAGGEGGSGGSAGAGGAAGTGGSQSAACGAEQGCETGSACATPINDICGGFDNLDTSFCVDEDSSCVVACLSGPCERPADCDETPCTLGPDGDALCESEGPTVCAGRGGLRGARCFDWGPAGSFCEYACGDGLAGCLPPGAFL